MSIIYNYTEDSYNFYNIVGQNLKRIRLKNNDSQEQLAEKVDMSRGFISQIESPKVDTGVSLDTLFLIARVYNIDISEFFIGYANEFIKKEEKQS